VLGDSQLRLSVQTGLSGLETFSALLCCRTIKVSDSGAGCNTDPDLWKVKGSSNLPGSWWRPPGLSVQLSFPGCVNPELHSEVEFPPLFSFIIIF